MIPGDVPPPITRDPSMAAPIFRESAATTAKKNDRIRLATPAEINARIDKDTEMRVWWHASRSRDELARRQAEVDQEQCVEQMLTENSSLLALAGTVLGVGAQPAGRDVLLLLRRLGVRTRSEIEAERHALKVLEGYFAEVAAATSTAPKPVAAAAGA